MVGQLQEIVNQIIDNNKLLKKRVNKMGAAKIKLPFIERFARKKLKLKGFLIQMHFKITQKAVKLPTPTDQVAYVGLFLIGRALKQFKPYLTKV